MAKKKIPRLSATEIAKKLKEVRRQIAQLKVLDTALTSDFKNALEGEQKDRAGNYKLSKSFTLKVVEPELAFSWAVTTNCVKIDTTKAKEVLRHTFDDPEKFGFSKVKSVSVVPIRKSIDEE